MYSRGDLARVRLGVVARRGGPSVSSAGSCAGSRAAEPPAAPAGGRAVVAVLRWSRGSPVMTAAHLGRRGRRRSRSASRPGCTSRPPRASRASGAAVPRERGQRRRQHAATSDGAEPEEPGVAAAAMIVRGHRGAARARAVPAVASSASTARCSTAPTSASASDQRSVAERASARADETASDGQRTAPDHHRLHQQVRQQQRRLPQVASLGLAEQEGGVAGGQRRDRACRQRPATQSISSSGEQPATQPQPRSSAEDQQDVAAAARATSRRIAARVNR